MSMQMLIFSGGGAGRQPPPLKMSISAHFQGWEKVGMLELCRQVQMLQVGVVILRVVVIVCVGSRSYSCCCCCCWYSPVFTLKPPLAAMSLSAKERKKRNHGHTFTPIVLTVVPFYVLVSFCVCIIVCGEGRV